MQMSLKYAENPEAFVKLLKKWIDARREFDIIDLFAEMHPADIAELIDRLEEEDQRALFALLDVETASEVITQLSERSRDAILGDISQNRLVQIIEDLESDDAADLLAELSDEMIEAALQGIAREDSREVQRLLRYDEESAGGLMQTELVKVNKDLTVDEAIAAVREQAAHVEDIHNVFVVDDNDILQGMQDIEDLIVHPSNQRIAEIMEVRLPSATPGVDQEEVARMFQKYDAIALPVVDESGRLLGRITVDDVVDVMEEEASEDFLKMAGTHEDELVYSGKILRISRLRLPWLIANMFGGLFVGYLLWLFEITLQEALILITFVPVITAMAGNAGIQSSTIVIRGFATGVIEMGQLGRHLFQEVRVAAIMGVFCGVIIGLVALFWHWDPLIGVIVGIAMLGAIVMANTLGTLVPALFKKIGIDPAVAAGPFVTSANDISGILIYFFIATFLVHLFH
jgi:magnesium transporter